MTLRSLNEPYAARYLDAIHAPTSLSNQRLVQADTFHG